MVKPTLALVADSDRDPPALRVGMADHATDGPVPARAAAPMARPTGNPLQCTAVSSATAWLG